MRKIRLVLLGVLCAGLLVCGIGTGVTLAEVSTFSYGGHQLLESAQSRTQSLTITLDLPESTVYLEDVLYGWGSDNRLMDVSRLEVSNDIPAGTLRLDATYDSAGPELAVWTDSWAEGNQEWVHVSWQAADDLALLFSCKDQLLSDLRDRRVTSYVPAELREMVVTVNPADADRIALL